MSDSTTERDDLKQYIGDGVYANFDGYQIWLTTEYGEEPTNRIALEPTVWMMLKRYAKDLTKRGLHFDSTT